MDRITPIGTADQSHRSKRQIPDQKGVQEIRDLPDSEFDVPLDIWPTGLQHTRRTDAIWPRQMERLD